MTVQIKSMKPEDWSAVRKIYESGIATGLATFDTSTPTWPVWDEDHLQIGRLVAKTDGNILGWAALSPASSN